MPMVHFSPLLLERWVLYSKHMGHFILFYFNFGMVQGVKKPIPGLLHKTSTVKIFTVSK